MRFIGAAKPIFRPQGSWHRKEFGELERSQIFYLSKRILMDAVGPTSRSRTLQYCVGDPSLSYWLKSISEWYFPVSEQSVFSKLQNAQAKGLKTRPVSLPPLFKAFSRAAAMHQTPLLFLSSQRGALAMSSNIFTTSSGRLSIGTWSESRVIFSIFPTPLAIAASTFSC